MRIPCWNPPLTPADSFALSYQVNPDLPLPPLTLRLSRYSKSAAKAVLAAGGNVTAVYHNALALRQAAHPEKFVGREVKEALPTLKRDIREPAYSTSMAFIGNTNRRVPSQNITRMPKTLVTWQRRRLFHLRRGRMPAVLDRCCRKHSVVPIAYGTRMTWAHLHVHRNSGMANCIVAQGDRSRQPSSPPTQIARSRSRSTPFSAYPRL
jgi:hypothetical protein